MKEKLNTIPSLTNSKWKMYDVVVDGKITRCGNNCIWHFTSPSDVHDEPEIWTGHWQKISDDKISIDRIDVGPAHQEDKYEAIFAGLDVMVVSGNDEVRNNRIIIGIRSKT